MDGSGIDLVGRQQRPATAPGTRSGIGTRWRASGPTALLPNLDRGELIEVQVPRRPDMTWPVVLNWRRQHHPAPGLGRARCTFGLNCGS